MMTDHFKRQEQTDTKQEIEICCYDRMWNYNSMVEQDESIAACAHNNEDDNKQNKDD